MPHVQATWIAADWGTSALRVWAMDADGIPLAQASSNKGMAALTRERYEPALLALISDWLPAGRTTSVIACGMVGARQGWVEAPYTATPLRPARRRPLHPRPNRRPPSRRPHHPRPEAAHLARCHAR